MKREIKFRAFDGNQMHDKVCVNHEGKFIKYGYRATDWVDDANAGIGMQFTGLTDKNGKEIYDGDVLKWKSSNPFSLGEIRIVSVTYTQAQFWCNGVGNMFGKFGVYLAELLTNERCEVIGNIYEHPNLLK